MRRTLLLAAFSVLLAASPSSAGDAHLARPYANPKPNVTVPVQTLSGTNIGCVIVPTPSTRTLLRIGKVHTVACVEATTGEVIVAVLRRNGTLFCSGSGHVDPANTSCANVTVCGTTDYYCLF